MYSSDEYKAKLKAVNSKKPFRLDGYVNLLNKYGMQRDNSEAYAYERENLTPETVLTSNYETNGLFAKIIDIPAQEAVKKGFNLHIADEKVEEYVQKRFRKIRSFEIAEESLKWSRLYGGALAVMLIDDGATSLEQPVNWKRAKKIEEIVTYERVLVTPDYASLYSNYGFEGISVGSVSKFRMPQYYNVFSIYGSFRVHESRCLVFRNGTMPENASTNDYRFWGIPEYNRIKRALRETVTSHSDAVKLLERSVQAVYKMKNLSQLLSTDEGEDQALRRLEIIDTARGFLNSIAIDSEGEDYDFKTTTLTGVKEVIDSACNMLSALTEIPQTKLFGRSPAGMNATGESDLENYYNFIGKIQQSQLRDNFCTLVDAIIQIGVNTGELSEKPEYELEFEPLWNEKESDRAAIEQTNAQTDMVKAQTAQMYIEMGVLDPAEERARLCKEGKFGITDAELPQQEEEPFAGILEQLTNQDSAEDLYGAADSVGVVVVQDGKVLVGNRDDNNQICGPGGHIESWEDAERAAVRETEEEFGITPERLIPLGLISDMKPEYNKPFIFAVTEFKGSPLTNTQEMRNNRFSRLSALKNEVLFEPFKRGVDLMLQNVDKFPELEEQFSENHLTADGEVGRMKVEQNTDGGKGSGNFGHKGVKGQVGGSAPSGSTSNNSGENKGEGRENESENESEKSKSSASSPSHSYAVPEGAKLYDRISKGDITVEQIKEDPVIRRAAEKYSVSDDQHTCNINTPEREQLRQQVADEMLHRGSISGYDDKGRAIYDGEVKKGHRAEIVIGPPAAGKSSVIVDKVSQNTGSCVLDSDEIKMLLPEFDEGRGAGKVHQESSDILNDRVIPQFGKGGSREGDNVVIPIVGRDTRKAEKYLKMLKDAGYEVHLSFNDVSYENSLKRATQRYISTGRFISPTYIAQAAEGPTKTYETLKAKGGFDSYSKYDNNVQRGQPAKKVERCNSKGESIDWEDWQ